jgi:predicted glycosyltransferase
MRMWIDIINPSDVFFFNSLISELVAEHEIYISLRNRDRSEIATLANKLNIKYSLIGKDYPNAIQKRISLVYRLIELFYKIPSFDISLSFGDFMSILVSKMRLKPSILYLDNDLALLVKGLFSESIYKKIEARSDYIICPSAFYVKGLINNGAKEERIFSFDGYKEDSYVADYSPDPNFIDYLPFKEFITIRPEAIFAAYVKETKSVVPLLLKAFVKEGFNIVYLPRIKEDIKYAKGSDVFIPQRALNGLDLCWYSDAVLTGSGTFAREAASMGTPAVSLFPGRLLSVDQQLVTEGKIFHSRDVDEIVDYVLSMSKKKKKLNLQRAGKVKKEVVDITKAILESINES